MKLLTKKQFLETPAPVAYVRYNESQAIEVKVGTEFDEKGQPTGWYYQDLFGFADPDETDETDGTDWLSLTAQKCKLEKGLSVPNHPHIKTSKNGDQFLVFEMNDMQNIIIPLAECFDKLTKDFFKSQEYITDSDNHNEKI